MLELFRAGGPLMWVILLCSVLALTIIFERMINLRLAKIAPAGLLGSLLNQIEKGQIGNDQLEKIRRSSLLGAIYAAGLENRQQDSSIIKLALEDAGRKAVHYMGRYLNALGTIASITPLLGLLGTVIGMIKVFNAITTLGVSDPSVLSGGISEALITTAAGLSVGIPCLMFYRYFRNRIIEISVSLEEHALDFINAIKRV